MQVFSQTLVHEGDALVTYLPRAGVARPTVVGGRRVLEAESPVVWLTFPGRSHDIGRFHTPDGRFTGYYANILTPVEIDRSAEGDTWHTTDLFLDVFLTPDGDPFVLDREELEQAVAVGWVDAATAREAERDAAALVRAARTGRWPPAVARAWTLERVLDRVRPDGVSNRSETGPSGDETT